MKKQSIMKIIASVLAVCVAAGNVPTAAWAAENPLLEGAGYVGTPDPGEKQSPGVTSGSGVQFLDGFSDEEYTEGVYEENQYGIDVDDVTVKTKYTVGSGHIYYAPAGEEGGSAFLRLENVPMVKGAPFYICYSLQAPLTVEAVGSNTIQLVTGETAVTLTGNGSFDNSIFSLDEINKENFNGELNAIVSRYDEAQSRCDNIVFGNFAFSGISRMEIGSQDSFTDTLTISEGASLTIPEDFTLRIYSTSGDDYNSFLNTEGRLINNGEIIFFGAEPEDPSAFVESFGFSGNGMVAVTSASDAGSITNDNCKVYDNNGFLDMTDMNGETEKAVEIEAGTPKSFYRVNSEGRLYYTPPAGDSKALLKACGIRRDGFHIKCASEELPATLCLEGDNYFLVNWRSDITLDGPGSFEGGIYTTGEFSIAESFEGGLNACIAQQIIEESGNVVSGTMNIIVYGDWFQMDDMDQFIAGYENMSSEEMTYRLQAALTVSEGSSYIIGEGHSAVFNNIGNDYEKYLKIDGKIINNGTIVCTGEVPDDRTAFIRSLNLSGSGFVEIRHENDDGSTVIDQYTNDGIKMAYQGGSLDFESNTGNDVRGDHMDEYGYCFEEKDGSYVLTLQDFTTPSGVVIPGDKPIIINSSGVCVIGELRISDEDASEVTLTFGGDGPLTVNKKIRISKKSVTAIAENAKITVKNGFTARTEGKGRLIVNGTLTAMCDETNRSYGAVYVDALEIGSTGILNVVGSRGVWIDRTSDTEQTDYSLEVKEGGQFIADCSEYGLVICNGSGHSKNDVISIPAGYLPHGYGLIEASEEFECGYIPLVLALEGSQITVDVYSRWLTGGEGAEGYIVIHPHSADYDKYIPDPDHAGRHIKYCSNSPMHSDSVETCTFGEWVQTVAPTETSTGVKRKTCSVCGRTEEETIPKLPLPTQTETPIQTEKPLPTQTEKPLPTQTEKPLPTQTETPAQTEKPLPAQTGETVTPGEMRRNSSKLDSGIYIKWKGKNLVLKWTKIAGAGGYDIFANQSGKKLSKKSLVQTVKNGKRSVSLTKIAGKKLSEKKMYSVMIKAWKYVDGKKIYIGNSRTYHIAGKENRKYTNAKKLKPAKKKYVLKKGTSAGIKVTVIRQSKKKKLPPKSYGPALQYWSDNEKIATVTQRGRVKAKKKGTCYIYVTTLNGVRAKIKITVK